MVTDHSTQYEGNPSSYHQGMCEDEHPDGKTDRWTDRLIGGLKIEKNDK